MAPSALPVAHHQALGHTPKGTPEHSAKLAPGSPYRNLGLSPDTPCSLGISEERNEEEKGCNKYINQALTASETHLKMHCCIYL